ncbi:MAG: glutamine amidotransferase [Beijerinckiaceae bacterium]
MPVLVVLHLENSTPARIGRLLLAMGHALDIRRPRFGDPLPATLSDHAGAVIFGGPQSANDPDDYIKAEVDWIGVALKEDKPLLGVCLGGQMIAKYLGERVFKHDDLASEVGYYPVAATPAGQRICPAAFPDVVYQWHKEGFDLPRGSTLLVKGCDLFPNQAFQYGSATAIQFHPEVTYAMIWRWTTRGHDRMRARNARDRHEHVEGWFRYDPAISRWISGFLESWIDGGVAKEASICGLQEAGNTMNGGTPLPEAGRHRARR